MRNIALCLALAACGPVAAPPTTDAGPATYDRAASGSFTGAKGYQAARCDGADVAIGGECFTTEGAVETSAVTGDGQAWECVVPLTPKGATIIALVHCQVTAAD